LNQEASLLKNFSCGELTKKNIGATVTLAGWVHRRRDHGGLVFIDLRDVRGITQLVFNPEINQQAHALAYELRTEYVVRVTGEVSQRPEGTENKNLSTGDIEVLVSEAEILNTSKTPPFYINEDVEVDENLLLKYRYLYLRRPRMKDNIILRHKVVKCMRDFLDARGFIEIETPILMKSTPEGARDYVVPSRVQPGKFYALPQSPQQLKQLLMVAGFEKYYQVARCFRDEDTRADRQPEFSQLDIEMSFVEEEDILALLEDMFVTIVETVKPEMRLLKPFPRLKYHDAMERYGTDKPDIRYGMEIKDLSDVVASSEFAVFRSVIDTGGRVRGICVPDCYTYSKKQIEELTGLARNLGAKGMVTMAIAPESGKDLESLSAETVKSVAAKHLTVEQMKEITRRFDAKAGDLLLIVGGDNAMVSRVLDGLRQEMAVRLKLADSNLLAFSFIVDFPLFDWNAEEARWDSMHHPFTAPYEEDIPLLQTDVANVRARHYDIVCNGIELSSGSIRINKRELQENIFRILGYSIEQASAQFEQLMEAFEYGAPPHGGIAPGIDRFVMILTGEKTIREVIAFPKNQNAVDVLFDAPSVLSAAQMDELHLKVVGDVRTQD
jgi:aspartyl-tRNA synthetase